MNKKIQIIIFLCISFVLNAEDSIYTFPIKPGTREWGNLKTENDRFESVQIPNKLLTSMSTDNLIKTCINFPLFGEFTAYNSLQNGIRRLINKFNGLQELYIRGDAPVFLVSTYERIDTVTMVINDYNIDREYKYLRLYYFEYLIAQDENINKMDESERIHLLRLARKIINYKIDSIIGISFFDLYPTLFIMAKILDKCNYEEFENEKKNNSEIDIFLKTGVFMSFKTLSSIICLSDKILI